MIKNLLSTLLIILAFFCGKYFAESEKSLKNLSTEPPRVSIEQLKTKMNISKNREEIEIFLNGVKMTEDVKLDLKK
jgi:uncharacterized membrane protein YvbJ